jgi:hypothetical protein
VSHVISLSDSFSDDFGGKDMKISPEQARANIIAADTKQHKEAVSALSSAMEQEREARYGKATRKPTATEQLIEALSAALKGARARQSD